MVSWLIRVGRHVCWGQVGHVDPILTPRQPLEGPEDPQHWIYLSVPPIRSMNCPAQPCHRITWELTFPDTSAIPSQNSRSRGTGQQSFLSHGGLTGGTVSRVTATTREESDLGQAQGDERAQMEGSEAMWAAAGRSHMKELSLSCGQTS